MSGSHELAEHFVGLLAPLGTISLRRFFGGWALTRAGVQFAMVMDTLYFCVDEGTRPGYEAAGAGPFAYRSGMRRVEVRRYYSVPAEVVDDEERLCALATEALNVAAAPKRPIRTRPAGGRPKAGTKTATTSRRR